MPYVLRGEDGKVIALVAQRQDENSEYLPANHIDVLGFIDNEGGAGDVHLVLRDSDAEIARVTEDLIHLLVKKNTILFTELPEAVQAKLIAREKLRSRLGEMNNSPVSDDETI